MSESEREGEGKDERKGEVNNQVNSFELKYFNRDGSRFRKNFFSFFLFFHQASCFLQGFLIRASEWRKRNRRSCFLDL